MVNLHKRQPTAMESTPKNVMVFFLSILVLQMITLSSSKAIIRTLPGYPGDLPFKLETGYIATGEKKDAQLFYYFVESTRYPLQDPIIFFIPGGPGASALITLTYELGPLLFDMDNDIDNQTLLLNPNAWTKVANMVFIDMPAGTGFSYATTKEGWISSDSDLASQANEFIRTFLMGHPVFLKNPLYIAGISYVGIVVPKVTLEAYEGNERGDQPTLNIQGYILISPLTDKFIDFNSRFEYAHRMAIISNDIYKLGLTNCKGNYVDIDKRNSLCASSLQQYAECTTRINFSSILDPYCDEDEETCINKYKKDIDYWVYKILDAWANKDDVQRALNIQQGKIKKWEPANDTIHYQQAKNDTSSYSYDIFSSLPYHKQLTRRNCRALILSGDHDMTFPYVGVEQHIASLNLQLELPWKPYYFDGQIAGYELKYTQMAYSLTYTIIRGAGHLVTHNKPSETVAVIERWFSSKDYSSDS